MAIVPETTQSWFWLAAASQKRLRKHPQNYKRGSHPWTVLLLFSNIERRNICYASGSRWTNLSEGGLLSLWHWFSLQKYDFLVRSRQIPIPGECVETNWVFWIPGVNWQSRKFNLSWLKRFPWLMNSKYLDGAFCLLCVCFGVEYGRNSNKLDKLLTSPITLWTIL